MVDEYFSKIPALAIHTRETTKQELRNQQIIGRTKVELNFAVVLN